MSYERYKSDAQKIRCTTAPVKISDIIVAPSGVKPSNGNYLGEWCPRFTKTDIDEAERYISSLRK